MNTVSAFQQKDHFVIKDDRLYLESERGWRSLNHETESIAVRSFCAVGRVSRAAENASQNCK